MNVEDSLPPDAYWGGYTEHGELLHLAVASKGGTARSACGLLLTGGAWVLPAPLHSGGCQRCAAAEAADCGGEVLT